MDYVTMTYHVRGVKRAAELGRVLDRHFARDVLTGLNFLVRYDGEVVVGAYFDASKTDEGSLKSARDIFKEYGREGEESFEAFLGRKDYVESWLGSPEPFISLYGDRG